MDPLAQIIEHLLDTDGLTKPATPRSKEQETDTRRKKQEVIFTTTPLINPLSDTFSIPN